jgi:hypothetical protein
MLDEKAPPSTKQKITDYHRDFVARLSAGRTAILNNAAENQFFDLGKHWITYDGILRNFRKMNLAQGVPRPVVNKFKAKLKKFCALLAGIDPSLATSPGSNTEVDRLTADAAVDVVKYCERVVNLTRLRLRLAKSASVSNNAFVVVGFDPEKGKIERVPKWECPNGHVCSADMAQAKALLCPECEEQLAPSQTEFDEIRQGELSADLCTIFEGWVDWTIPTMEDQPAFMWRRLRPLEWLYERHPEMRGKMPEGEAAPSDTGINYLQQIARMAPAVGGRFAGTASYANSCIVDDLYVMPCVKFPKGLWARLLSTGQVLEYKTPIPFHTGTEEERGEPILPVVHFGIDDVQGTLLCNGPADDLKSPQRERNRMLASIAMYFSRTANSMVYLPQGIDIQQIPGIEGAVLRGETTTAGGGEPKRIEAAQLSTAFGQAFERVDGEMDEILNIRELADEAPRIDSGYAMQVLDERKHQAHTPVFTLWEQSYAQLARVMFYTFRAFAPEEAWYAVRGERARWTVKQIRKANLRGGVDIDMEAGSGYPKNRLQRRASLEQAVQLGVADVVNDPKTKLLFARELGVREVMESMDVDMRVIAREHDAVIAWAAEHFDMNTGEPLEGDTSPESSWPVFVDPDIDNLELHYLEHAQWMKSEEFQALPPAVQELFRVIHMQPHSMLLGMTMQSPNGPQADAQAQGGGGAQQPGGAGKAESTANAAATKTAGGGGYAGRSERQRQEAA